MEGDVNQASPPYVTTLVSALVWWHGENGQLMTSKWREIDTSSLGGRAVAHFQISTHSP